MFGESKLKIIIAQRHTPKILTLGEIVREIVNNQSLLLIYTMDTNRDLLKIELIIDTIQKRQEKLYAELDDREKRYNQTQKYKYLRDLGQEEQK